MINLYLERHKKLIIASSFTSSVGSTTRSEVFHPLDYLFVTQIVRERELQEIFVSHFLIPEVLRSSLGLIVILIRMIHMACYHTNFFLYKFSPSNLPTY